MTPKSQQVKSVEKKMEFRRKTLTFNLSKAAKENAMTPGEFKRRATVGVTKPKLESAQKPTTPFRWVCKVVTICYVCPFLLNLSLYLLSFCLSLCPHFILMHCLSQLLTFIYHLSSVQLTSGSILDTASFRLKNTFQIRNKLGGWVERVVELVRW